MLKVTLFLLVASVIALTLAETIREKYMKILRECDEDPKTKLDEELWEKNRAGERIRHPNNGPHSLCLSKKHGLQDENGKVNKAEVRRGLEDWIKDEATLGKAIAECTVDKDTPEETAINLGECRLKYAPRPSRPHH